MKAEPGCRHFIEAFSSCILLSAALASAAVANGKRQSEGDKMGHSIIERLNQNSRAFALE
jgi:hypothetical protein